MVLLADDLHVSRSLRKTLRKGVFRFTLDEAFPEVIDACSRIPRPGQRDTWITPEMKHAYVRLHEQGLAHSAEAWQEKRLAGGLYGVSLGGAFFGESMFTKVEDASKAAFVVLVEQLRDWGITLIDAQVFTPHLARFGATEWPRREYLAALRKALRRPGRQGRWRFDEGRGGSEAGRAPSAHTASDRRRS
jgi:leucyl/phenylalanyl-tRNA--protein transferase